MIFLARMMGFVNQILALIPTNVKIFICVVLAIFSSFFIVSKVYYSKGVEFEKSRWEQLVQVEKEKNATLSSALITLSANYGELYHQMDQSRLNKENNHQNTINTIVKEKPIYKECKVDRQIIDEQNALKALGPE